MDVVLPFPKKRRQQFLDARLYEKTQENQQDLLAGNRDNLQIQTPGTEAYSVSYAMLYLESLWSWMLDYTAGCAIEGLAPRLSTIVDAFEAWNEAHQLWLKAVRQKFPEDGPYEYRAAPDFSSTADYEDTMQLLGIAVLLRDVRSIGRIVQVMRSHRGEDALFEQLIGAYVEDPIDIETCILGKPYTYLLNSYYSDSDDSSLEEIGKYLKNWYPAMKDHPRWYDGHLRASKEGHAPYYGYWAFEAGATVYLLNINDSLIDHLVYPKDLVAYGKSLREQDRYTSQGQSDAPQAGRVQGGQLCPSEGYWETPARANSRRFFQQGEIMPVFDGANYGATIWQRSTDQNSAV
ncbi:PoNe immunity protein domain-containing protein [Undibacterium sp. TJN25]|uniref:PoNe immunity protein domain-containing protein n=1 Tax=Undibacterium sp. TJN25 TaxID=3413056 RepID=UPI003BF3366C